MTDDRVRTIVAGLLAALLLAVAGSWGFQLAIRQSLIQAIPFPVSPGATEQKFRFEGHLVLAVDQAAMAQSTPDGIDVPPLNELRGQAVSWDGTRIYAADPRSRVLTVFDRTGRPLKVLGNEGKGKLRGPSAVAEAPDGRIFVADRLDNRLLVYDHDGGYIEDFRPANMPASFPLVPIAIAFQEDGTMYLGDGNGPVYIFDGQSNLRRQLIPPDGAFQAAWGVAVNASGQIAVTDSSHRRAFTFESDGSLLATLGASGGLSLPRGIAIDNRGRVMVADAFAHRIQVYRIDGQSLGSFGEEGPLDGQFRYPESIVTDNQGVLFVGDRGNRRIQIWRY